MIEMFARRSHLVVMATVGTLVVSACGGEPTVLAPTGAALTLVAATTALSFNGTAAVNARILTSGGQPVPDGTMVSFATTLGSIAPVEVPTAAGVATTTFTAGVASGTAIVTASSGAVGGDNGLRIAIGVAAVARVQVTATPPTVPFGGGTSVIAAVAIDANNNPLVGIPVTFSTSTGGTIAPAAVKTDPKGIAEATLTANQRVTVTAIAAAAPSDPGFGSVGTTQGSVVVGATPQPVPVVTVIAPPNAVAGTPVPFTIGAVPAPMSNTAITNVSVDFGDGSRVNLGAASGPAISVQHVFTTGGSYTVSVTATDSGGGTSTAAAVIVVGFQQPATARITADAVVKIPSPSTQSLVTLTATLTPASLIGARYEWSFVKVGPPDTSAGSATTTPNQVQQSLESGTYRVTVKVTLVGSGQTVDGSLTFIVP